MTGHPTPDPSDEPGPIGHQPATEPSETTPRAGGGPGPGENDRGEIISMGEHRRRSRRAFLTWGASAVIGAAGFRWIQGRPEDDNLPDVIRRGLETNEAVWTALGSETRTARTFDLADRRDLRVNGRHGLDEALDIDSWALRIVGPDGGEVDTLTLEDIQALPRQDLVWEHLCVEGWSTVVHWTGARLTDLVSRYHGTAVPPDYRYVSLRTPDEVYYVGLDRETALHPQTLLAWGLNGEPLSEGHGAPLRLASPLVYGIKQLKRIGTIELTDRRPDDYWAERGYDWHARF